jgi:choline dehydrogenase-like flavoprotein
MPMHESAQAASSWREAKAAIEALPMRSLGPRVVSAHVMGGCAMGRDPRTSVVGEDGVHHHLANVSIHDASVFPTSIGANPQLSIYASAARLSAALARRMRPGA